MSKKNKGEIEMKIIDTCEHCIYAREEGRHEESTLFCCRKPPKRSFDGDNEDPDERFPRVTFNDWCGEFRGRHMLCEKCGFFDGDWCEYRASKRAEKLGLALDDFYKSQDEASLTLFELTGLDKTRFVRRWGFCANFKAAQPDEAA